jgi:3-phenylpropionate/trans-cinnamate dioxygenase ferredoxin subunit
MEKIRMDCMKNGPYKVVGDLLIVDANGKSVSAQGATTYHLCRCGGSGKKPFCDGTHAKIKFVSE